VSEQVINSKPAFDAYIIHLRHQFDKHRYLRVDMKTGKQRSLTENRCLHLYCTQLADALNDAGLDFRQTIKDGVDVPWTPELAKDYLWRPIQKAITGKDSTTKPERGQYGEIYDVLNRHISGKMGVYVAWPSKESMNHEHE
jgi:hypothetical protein